MRSSWEIAYAGWLDRWGISWEYEPRIDLGDGIRYYPDFLLADGRYIEIKGYFSPKAKRKIELFKERYPDFTLEILREAELKQLGVI